MSEKYEKEQRLIELCRDRNSLSGKLIGLKLYCQKHPNDVVALHRLVCLIKHGKKVLGED